ncbi:hypothetical protein Tco_0032282 [Tanacetum coccineum]
MRITSRIDSSVSRMNSDQKDKTRHAMDDNGFPSKEIHGRHQERVKGGGRADDTTTSQYVPILKRTDESRTELALLQNV